MGGFFAGRQTVLDEAMSANTSLGTILKRIRKDRHWTLAEMSDACGIPLSTLSKIENDKLTLTYDRLQQLSRSLGIALAELFTEGQAQDAVVTRTPAASPRSTPRVTVETPNYVYNYLCSDLRKRRMIPIHVQITGQVAGRVRRSGAPRG